MGLSLDPKLQLAGYKISFFKQALQGFARTLWRGSVIDLKSIFPLRKDGAIVVEECLDRGLIDPITLDLTPAGAAVGRAKLCPRSTLVKANAVLEAFLDHFDTLERDENVIRRVEQAWLYGSLLREEETVGDIDLAMTFSRRPCFADDHEVRYAHVEATLSGLDKAPPEETDPWDKEHWLNRRQLFGPRRHMLLAGVQDGIGDLASMGVPCRLIYDRERGGRVQDSVLPRHPSSTGRDPTLAPPVEMPDFMPGPIGPMDARWVTGFHKSGGVDSFDLFRGSPQLCRQWFPNYPLELFVFADGHDAQYSPWKPARLRQAGLDGRAAVCLVNTVGSRSTSFVLNRRVDISAATWLLNVGFSDVAAYRSRGGVEPATLPDLAAIVAIILAVDAERMTRRAAELRRPPTIGIHIDGSGLDDPMRSLLMEVLRTHLERELAGEGTMISLDC